MNQTFSRNGAAAQRKAVFEARQRFAPLRLCEGKFFVR
jgi:hypothetical protein